MKKTLNNRWFLLMIIVLDLLFCLVTAAITMTDYQFFVAFKKILSNDVANVYSLFSVGIGFFDFFSPFLGQQTSKIKSSLVTVVCFSTTLIYRCICNIFPSNLKEYGSIFSIASFILIYVYFATQAKLQKEGVKNPNISITSKEPLSTERALVSYAKRKIAKCHEAITSIQLHKVTRVEDSEQVYYCIDYIDSGRKSAVYPAPALNINAVMDTRLELPKAHEEFFRAFLETYCNYLYAENILEQKVCIKAMENLSKAAISTLKDELQASIKNPADITIKDCCIARLIMVYLSCLSQIGIENADDYAGIRCESLNIGNTSSDGSNSEDNIENCEFKNINNQLFSKFRTGFLGAILLKSCPYVFYYEREHNSAKEDRRYISFFLGHEKAKNSYLVLITVNIPKNVDRFYASLLRAIKTIQQECNKIYMKYEVK